MLLLAFQDAYFRLLQLALLIVTIFTYFFHIATASHTIKLRSQQLFDTLIH
jgi:hypothetical protein